jgi:hypothetical protein
MVGLRENEYLRAEDAAMAADATPFPGTYLRQEKSSS